MGKPNVLVVDDETTICYVLKDSLESQGADVRTANSGEDGLAMVRERPPDVMLLDIVLPGINGVQVLAEVKKIAPETRVIVMTSHATADSAVEAIRKGALDYVQKPFDHIDEVWPIVQRALAADSREETKPSRQPADVDGPGILVVDDEESIRHVLVSLLEMNGCTVREAGSSEAAIDLLKDWEPDVALVDIVLPGKSGISFLGEIKRAYPDTEALIMTSKASTDTAVKAIRLGAYSYIKKPFQLEEVWEVVSKALERHRLNVKNRALVQKQEARRRELSESVSLDETRLDIDQEILDEFLALACHELNVGRATLMLKQGEVGQLQVVASRGVDGQAGQVAPGQGIPGWVFASGHPYLAESDASDGPDRPDRNDPASFLGDAPISMSVPVGNHGTTLGVINVGASDNLESFGSESISYLVGMGGQLAATIEGAVRANQLQEAYESLKATQQQLVFSERIKAVGQMAAGVAHDFNNVLSVILARAQFIERKLEQGRLDPANALEHVTTIIKTALQGAEAIKRIQDYTRIRKDVVRSPVDINQTIRDAVEIARPKWSREAATKGCSIEVDMGLGYVPPVSGNRYELAQVFGNLIFNAVEAMPEGGKLSFRSFLDGDMVVVEVADTGTGIDAQGLEHLFEPFYTTKLKGQGLGTSILYGIVTRHGGDIAVDSTVGRGTTFRVSLPQAMTLERDVESAVEEMLSSPVTARVLLVDDDETVRETYEEVLSTMGHQVATCGSGEEALRTIQQTPFDVVVTDMSMHGMTGLDLTRRIKADHPGLSVVLSSGWAVSEDSPEVAEAGVDFVLTKPVMLDDLLGMVQKAARGSVKG